MREDSVKQLSILLTTIGRRTYLVDYFQKALDGEGKVYVANSDANVPAFEKADGHVIVPLTYDENYVPFLLDYCKKEQIDAIIPVFDLELPILAKHNQEFEQIGTKVVVAPLETTQVCNDKWLSYLKLVELGIDTPKTYHTLQDAQRAIADGEVHYPLMVKPRWGMGTMSTFEVENDIELEVLYEKCKRDIFHSYLKYESNQDADYCVLVQEKVSGQEYGLDILNDIDGRYQTTIVKKKIEMRANETDCAVTIEDEQLESIGKRIAEGLHHLAVMDVDVMRDGDKAYVLDMNARFGGGYPFSHIAGVDMPKAIVQWLRGEQVEISLLQAQVGVLARKDITLYQMR